MRLRGAPVLHLTVGRATVHAEAVRAGVVVWAGDTTYDSCDDLAEVVATLAAAPSERCRRLEVTLERPPAQARTLKDLPPVRERELAPLVANQAGRFFRRNGAPLVTDATWVTNGAGRVTRAAAVEEPIVLALIAGAKQAGLVMGGIGAAGLERRIQLLPPVERAARARARRRSLVRLGTAVLALWCTVGIAFTLRMIGERRAIDAELSAASAPLAALREVRQEMRGAEAMVVGIADARRERGEALTTFVRVSDALPDSAVFTSYAWRADGSGVVGGSSRRAADVLAALDRTKAVTNARIEGAIVRETLGGHDWERFTLIFGASNP